MALLNKYYIFVETEDVQRGVTISQHPVEKGLDLTDNVKREPVTIIISGEIVGAKASTILSKITALHQKGKYVKYVGRNVLKKGIITSFNTSHPNTIQGGCSFDMEIREIRIAKSPVTSTSQKKTKGGTKQITAKSKSTVKTYKVKKGDCLWKIATKYYGSGKNYTKIAKKNGIKKPYIIKTGQVLIIP